ncbi:predicted protein [Theileria orientalis strain Shintoku]|uniref:Translation initiation factor beta propellor-like domain-containing protein n=1 Tax=Theileria orientalis strain Shintoku TaxID=869250 RepID=J4C848_THEOR|nr:predicted protein [Theileria orientalis strain Shintoku]BAM40163.1 predicted protein [Theileria orientalis strain Shintoku]|eukprot:XP_009690464.1 predicted protein [Theileria orientalis strain Shintoku]
MNLFTLHTKNGFYIYRCIPINTLQNDTAKNGNSSEEEPTELINNFKPDCIWSQDRFARQCVCSYNNNLAVLDDRSGLSIIYMKNGVSSDLAIDTLRGVGKFKNMYTPLGCKNIKHLQWSNNGIYLAVYFNLPNYSEAGLCLDDNLHIWDISKKNIVATFSTRRLSPEQWPVIKWLGDSDNFALCHNHQVNVYSIASEPSSLKTVRCLLSIAVPMVFSVEVFHKPQKNGCLSEGDKAYLACFSPTDANNTPGNLRISTLEWTGEALKEVQCENHELRFTDSAELLWSPSGQNLIAVAQSTVDMAGEKYGSTANCLLYSNTGRLVSKVNTATTHDVRWNPKKDEFILMQGNMPCKITLYNAELETLFEFPNMYRNTIKWNPMGNMVALGGFGNLAGEICFWYKKEESDEMEQIVQFKEPCTVISEWSLDSKYFMTASTFPRMKVDNFYKIFNCEGYLIASESVDECYDVSWFCGNQDEKDFIRPRVRKSLVRKAVYRPKMLQKTTKQSVSVPPTTSLTNTRFSKAPGSPIFTTLKSTGENPLLYSPPNVKSHDAGAAKEKMSKSVFSNEHGNKCDPSTDLIQSFKHIFSLSFMREQNQMMERQANVRDQQNYRQYEGFNDQRIGTNSGAGTSNMNNMVNMSNMGNMNNLNNLSNMINSVNRQKYGDNVRQNYTGNSGTLSGNNGHGSLGALSSSSYLRGSYGDNGRSYGDNGRSYGDNGRSYGDNGKIYGDNGKIYGDNGRSSYSESSRASLQERLNFHEGQRQASNEARQGLGYGGNGNGNGNGNGQRKNTIDESKQNSMFIRLKNQLHSDKAKTQNHSIMDEGQLLRLLLEAKIRSKPN